MRICAICETPYQVMTMMNYATAREEFLDYKIDLFVGSKFKTYLTVAGNVSKESIFDDVYVYDYSRAGSAANRLNFISKPSKYISRLCGKELKQGSYNVIFTSNLTTFMMAMVLANPDAEVYYYDDGIASYTYKIGPNYLTGKKRLLFKFYRIDIERFYPKKLYLNNASMFIDGWNVPLVQMPPLSGASEECYAAMSRVFGSIPEFYKDHKKIFLTNPIEMRDESVRALQEQRKNKVIEILSGMDVVRRPHPRETVKPGGNMVIDDSGCLWEQVCMKTINSEYTLIGAASTAMISPKMFFDQEPRLIFLFKALDFPVDKTFLQLLDKLIKSYKNPDDIVIVENIDELPALLS